MACVQLFVRVRWCKKATQILSLFGAFGRESSFVFNLFPLFGLSWNSIFQKRFGPNSVHVGCSVGSLVKAKCSQGESSASIFDMQNLYCWPATNHPDTADFWGNGKPKAEEAVILHYIIQFYITLFSVRINCFIKQILQSAVRQEWMGTSTFA